MVTSNNVPVLSVFTMEPEKTPDVDDDEEKRLRDEKQVIHELKKEYRRMVRIQKYVFVVFSAVASMACVGAGLTTGLHPPFYLSGLAFFLLIACETIQQLWCWIVSGSVEVMAIYFDYRYREALTTTVWVGVHIIYCFLVVYWLSSHHFFHTFPEKIHNLSHFNHGTAKKKD